ncbi:MAG: hypothetical protein PHF60_05140 [Candidatus ainarchaeum sp.]|nr:hypothetical protein [Candidatus ainarchaeum sp.]
MASETYGLVNAAWKSTTKILFGQPIGELEEFEDYLQRAVIGHDVKSSYSSRPLLVASENYPPTARFFDYPGELEQFSKEASKPVDINKIKDLDSLREAVKEKIVYGANKSLGNSQHIEHSDAIIDSTALLNCSMIIRSRYLAYSYLMRDNEYTFGSTSSGASSFIVRCFYNTLLKRCFECSYSTVSSDCYFSYDIHGCNDCIFAFNVQAKHYIVANVQLDRDSYLSLKSKLIGEIAEELKAKKRLEFSLFDLMNRA